MKTIGRRNWALPGGRIPPTSQGHEPELTSRDELSILNATDQQAHVDITIYYADREPVGPYSVAVPPRRVKVLRLNDLINPEAMPLGTNYALVSESEVPVVVQFFRLDSSLSEGAMLGALAFPDDV